MIQAYQGYFKDNGYFVADNPSVKLPTKRRVIVTILEDEYSSATEVNTILKAARLRRVLQEAHAVEDDVMTDVDWDDLTNARTKTNAGMSRAVIL